MNPYFGKDFFQFFTVLAQRLLLWLQGRLSFQDLASDEVQLLVLLGIALSTACVGVFLVFKKMTMLANSLSHTILLGIVVSYLLWGFSFSQGDLHVTLKGLLLAAFLAAILTTLLTQFLVHFVKLQEDASIGLVFTTLFALGVVLVTLFTRSSHVGTEVILGNVDALHRDDLKLVFFVVVVDVIVLGVFFKECILTTFDPHFADSVGVSSKRFSYLLVFLTALTSVGAFRAVGVLLVLSFLVSPVLAAERLTRRFRPLLFWAIGIGFLCSFLAVALSRHLFSVYGTPVSTAGLVSCLLAFSYVALLPWKAASTKL